MKAERKKKSPAKKMEVFIAGVQIIEVNSTETFLSALRVLGPSKIASMTEIKVDGLPLIVPTKDYRMQMNKIDDNWYVCTHIPTIRKKRILENISQKFGIEVLVNLI